MAKGGGTKMTYLLWVPLALADIVARLQPLEDLFNCGFLFTSLFCLQTLPASTSFLLLELKRLLDKLNILEAQLFADNVEIAGGVHVTFNVGNLDIIEAADDLEEGVNGANVGKEGIAKTGTSRGATSQAGNVIDCEVRRHPRLWVILFA